MNDVGKSHLDEISAHVERHFGPIGNVLHEIRSETVHVDILCVEPTTDRPWRTLVTSGMSDLAMTLPPEAAAGTPRHVELVLSLAADHPMDQLAWEDEGCYWPIRKLKVLARMPHQLGSCFGANHTMATSPPEPVAPGVPFVALATLELLTPEARRLRCADGTEITFLQVVALHADELAEKLEQGGARLAGLFDHELLRIVGNDRQSLTGGPLHEVMARYHRGRAFAFTATGLLAATIVCDFLACLADDSRLPWGRLGFGIALVGWLVQGGKKARFTAIVLQAIGAVLGSAILARDGLPTTRHAQLLFAIPAWIASAWLLWRGPEVAFWFRVKAVRSRDVASVDP